jgi:hypothetical protein
MWESYLRRLMGEKPTKKFKKREDKGIIWIGVSNGFQFIQSHKGPRSRIL